MTNTNKNSNTLTAPTSNLSRARSVPSTSDDITSTAAAAATTGTVSRPIPHQKFFIYSGAIYTPTVLQDGQFVALKERENYWKFS